ncbi:hypothetical protein IP86_17095 [Rhodopseudomonas sp. AAP120]|uniref:hypothetical protein n=1 Tax=Rhodopseudomonas TaxID=1073 RepID=UPI000164BE6D|nr:MULTISPECIES: hypothetical protein [Rhodopseudomonas]ACE99587.1 hypothetical protein Rpal_1031 [Rhodopseudomonas palustris TIE-1]KPF96147.1 hypothetical protein IP86_17095 [Rhodopseudomonas sp. AAP120]
MKKTYTLFLQTGPREEVLARGVTLMHALVLALEHGDKGKATVIYGEEGRFRFFAIGRRSAEEGTFESVLSVAVPRSGKPAADSNRAMRMIGKKLLREPRAFWDGYIESDEDYERRHATPREMRHD